MVDEKSIVKEKIEFGVKAAREAAKEAKDKIIKEQRLKRKRKVAKKNVGKKLGVISADLDVSLQTLFSIDPNLIPSKELEAYTELVNEFSERKAVLNLNDKAVTLEKALNIINAVEQEVQVDDEGGLTKEKKREDKVFDETKEIDTIIKDKLANLQISNIPDERSRQIARDINNFTKQDIESLIIEKEDGTKDYKVIETLKAVKENIKNGFVPKAANDIVVSVKSNNQANEVTPLMPKSTGNIYTNLGNALSITKTALVKSPSGTNVILDRIRSSPLFFIDDILGNFNSKTIYNNTFRVMAEAYEKYKSEVTKLQTKIDAADQILEYGGVNRLRKAFRVGKSQNEIVKQKYKIRLFQLEREHLSNIVDGKENSKAPSGLAFLDKTIDAIKNEEILSQVDLKILEGLRNEFVQDNKLNYEKLENSLNANEKKALALYDEVNNSLADKAVFISSTLHGNRVNLLNNYNHHVILEPESQAKDNVFNEQKAQFVAGSLATKSGTIIERTPGAKPISFDPSYSARRGAQQTLLDYEMTDANRIVAKTINKINKNIKSDRNTNTTQRTAARALVSAMNEINGVLFEKTFQDISTPSLLARRVMTLGYQAALGSVPRAAGELIANMGIMLKNPVLSAQSLAKYGKLAIAPSNASLGFDILTNLKSTETSKMYDTENLQSKYTNMSDFMVTSPASGSATSRMSNALGIAAKASGVKQLSSIVNNIANRLISFPDQGLSRPIWFGTFADVFAKKTKELNSAEVNLTVADYKKIADGTSPYLRPEYKEAREAATQAADANSIAMATSVNPYNVIIKNIPRAGDGAINFYRRANSYMARFSLFEYATARNAINSLYKNGNLSRPEALGLLAGITYRMTAYMVVYSTLTSELDELLFDADDKKDDDLEDLISRQTVGSILTLLTRGTLGNIPVIPINYMIEQGINEPFLGDFRDNQEYDPYKHAIVFSQLTNRDLKEKDFGELMVKIFAGPYGPLVASLIRTGELGTRAVFNKTKESRDKNIEELTNRMTVEALGNSGLIPFYKDVRRILLKKRFADKPSLTKAQLKELREKYPEYFSDVESSTSRTQRPTRKQSKKRQSRPTRR